jgi:hypothetical protein
VSENLRRMSQTQDGGANSGASVAGGENVCGPIPEVSVWAGWARESRNATSRRTRRSMR